MRKLGKATLRLTRIEGHTERDNLGGAAGLGTASVQGAGEIEFIFLN